jgi:BMFP domain-containing protein YqiC
MTDIRTRAREMCDQWLQHWQPGARETFEAEIAAALRTARLEALEEAAKVAENRPTSWRGDILASPYLISEHDRRANSAYAAQSFTAKDIANAIRSLKGE